MPGYLPSFRFPTSSSPSVSLHHSGMYTTGMRLDLQPGTHVQMQLGCYMPVHAGATEPCMLLKAKID